MSSETYYAALFTEQVEVAFDELVQASGLTAEEIVELVEHGVIAPVSAPPTPLPISAWRFSATTIAVGRRASRLKADFDLNVSGLALALTFLERIEALEEELNRLRCGLLR
jgi:chaperone modulatory protein CbpM